MKIKKLLIAVGALALAGCGVSPLGLCQFDEETTSYICQEATPTGDEITVEPATGQEP
ncbi:MAG TPA: hypothetical protein VGA20_08095 [Gemmatimonadales bacterium]